MADFVLTQTDAQVQSVLNDAQDAQGAGAQTTLTTEYVMLKDTEGRYHKILKSSLTEACRNVLAGLLVNNDKGTTISQIAAIASGDFGSVTPANLASVLGVVTTSIPGMGLNRKTYSQVNGDATDGMPGSDWYHILRFGNTQYGLDMAIPLTSPSTLYIRVYNNTTQSSWRKVGLGTI